MTDPTAERPKRFSMIREFHLADWVKVFTARWRLIALTTLLAVAGGVLGYLIGETFGRSNAPARRVLLRNLVLGENGSGKTRLLQMIAFAVTGRTELGGTNDASMQLMGPLGGSVRAKTAKGFGWTRHLIRDARENKVSSKLEDPVILSHSCPAIRHSPPNPASPCPLGRPNDCDVLAPYGGSTMARSIESSAISAIP